MPGEGSALPQPAAKLLDALLGPRDEAAQEATATAPRPMPVTSFGSVAPQPLPAAVPAEAVAAPEPGFVAVEHELDLAQESQWLDRLARDIARTAGSEGKLHFQLKPEHLGALTVEMSQGSAGTSVRMTADSEAARALIADAQPRLIAEARAQGARIASTHVDVGAHGHMASDGRHQREPAQHQARPGRGQIKTDVTEQPRRWLNASDRYA
jgi:flagellar hook-length control protein FliK